LEQRLWAAVVAEVEAVAVVPMLELLLQGRKKCHRRREYPTGTEQSIDPWLKGRKIEFCSYIKENIENSNH
jgi:hypothetical protein